MKLKLLVASTLPLIMALINTKGYSQQIDKYRLVNIATVYKDNEGSFVYRDEWDSCNFILTIDAKKNKAILYANYIENKFDILTSRLVNDEQGDAIIKFICLDNQGTKCGLILTTLAHPSGHDRQFIKIEYNNKEIVYKFTYD